MTASARADLRGGFDAHTAFGALFDDAAIFPPGDAPMASAVTAHLGHRRDRHADLVGPFVCSGGRLPELTAVLADAGETLDVAVVLPAGAEWSAAQSLTDSDRIRVVAVEKQVGPDRDGELAALSLLRERLGAVHCYAELSPLPQHADELAPLAQLGLRAKFRTGGLVAAAFPSEAALAAALCAAAGAGVAAKCTAGLHHAVRHTSAEGFEHHGFANVLLAAAAAGGQDAARVAAVLAERDGAVLAERLRRLTPAELAQARKLFVSFGTCSIGEPLADLARLGLLR